MNRRQKIIVSITGIFIVLLALIGLTYAYFLTKITPNSNPTSISVTTANLELVYGENTSVIQGINNAEPGYSVTKTFSATNKGAATSYAVVLENVTNSFTRKQDVVYTLTCESSDGVPCDGVSETQFPGETELAIIVGNNIADGKTTNVVHNYTLTVTYKEAGVNQNVDMNKTFSAKVNIIDVKGTNPYTENTAPLAYNVINNSILNKNGTTLVATPPTKVGIENSYKIESEEIGIVPLEYEYPCWWILDSEDSSINWEIPPETECSTKMVNKYISDEYGKKFYVVRCDGTIPMVEDNIMKYESVLSVSPDNYGNSYYFRGKVEDNYVNFNDMCWRIVRIDGEGNVKLLLENQSGTCDIENYSENRFIENNFEDTTALEYCDDDGIGGTFCGTEEVLDFKNGTANALKTFQTEKMISVLSKMKTGDWCYNFNFYKDINRKTLLNPTYNKNFMLGQYEEDNLYRNVFNMINVFSDAYIRLSNDENKEISLKCPLNYFGESNFLTQYNDGSDMKVGLLTIDEILLAGVTSNNSVSYTYLGANPEYIKSMTPYTKDGLYGGSSIIPAVILNKNVTLTNDSGDGTKTKPYKVS